MAQAADSLFQRMESALEQWAADVTSTHENIAERLSSAKARFANAPERELEVEQTAAILQVNRTQFTTLQDAMHQCVELSRQSLDRTADLEKAFNALAEDVHGLKTLAVHSGTQANLDGIPEAPNEGAVEELRALLDEQRDRIARLELELAAAAKGGPTPQQWSRVERDLARLRGELSRVRGVSADNAGSPAATISGGLESIASNEPIDLDLTGFDNAGRRRRMGEILIQAGVLSEAQLERALEIQQEQPQRRLGSVLIELGYTESDIVAQVLACQARVPFVRLDRDDPDPAAAHLISERLASHHVCIPLRVEDDRLVLAMANPMDLVAIQDIEHATGKSVDPVSCSADNILRAIKAYFGTEAR